MKFIKDNLKRVRTIALLIALSSSLVGCQSELLDETDAQEVAELIIDLKTDDRANTRTIDISQVDGLALVKVTITNDRHQDMVMCTDGNYGNITFRVPLGAYDIDALATDASDYELDDNYIVLPNGGNIWHARIREYVTETGKETLVPIQLKRMNSKVIVTPLDEIPEDCKNISVTLTYGGDTMSARGGIVSQNKVLTKTVEVPEAYKGTVGRLSIGLYTLLEKVVSTVTIDIHAIDYEGNVIGQVDNYDVILRRNQQAYVKGNLFTSKVNSGITIDYDWGDLLEYQW